MLDHGYDYPLLDIARASLFFYMMLCLFFIFDPRNLSIQAIATDHESLLANVIFA